MLGSCRSRRSNLRGHRQCGRRCSCGRRRSGFRRMPGRSRSSSLHRGMRGACRSRRLSCRGHRRRGMLGSCGYRWSSLRRFLCRSRRCGVTCPCGGRPSGFRGCRPGCCQLSYLGRQALRFGVVLTCDSCRWNHLGDRRREGCCLSRRPFRTNRRVGGLRPCSSRCCGLVTSPAGSGRLNACQDGPGGPVRPSSWLPLLLLSCTQSAQRDEGHPIAGWPSSKECTAATYSPTRSPAQYHRR